MPSNSGINKELWYNNSTNISFKTQKGGTEQT